MRRARGRRRTLCVAAALLVHVLLVAPLLWGTPSLRLAPVTSQPDLRIDLVRGVDSDRRGQPSTVAAAKGVTPSRTASAAVGRPQPASTPAANARPPVAPSPIPTSEAQTNEAQTSEAQTSEAPAGSGIDARPAPGAQPDAGASNAAAVHGALRRAFGCLNPSLAGLTDGERTACRDRFRQGGVAMGAAVVDPINSVRKRAGYDAVKAARDAINSYNPVSGPMPGHGPALGCKNGKCGFIPPSGVLTEEWGSQPF